MMGTGEAAELMLESMCWKTIAMGEPVPQRLWVLEKMSPPGLATSEGGRGIFLSS